VGGGEGSIIGAVLGRIQVMQHLDNITEVGRAISVALVATIYGSNKTRLATNKRRNRVCGSNYAKAPRISRSGRSQL
jgi:hypothetical protein